MAPADERLHVGDLVRPHVDDGMVVQLEFVARERIAQIDLERSARVRVGPHHGFEQAVGAAAADLGLVEGQIGALDELIDVGAVLWSKRNPDAGRDIEPVTVERIGGGKRLEQPVGGGNRFFALVPVHRRHDCKFVAAEPSHRIGLAQAPQQTPRDRFEKLVADRMPERIVDALEEVEVQHEQGDRLAAPAQARQVFLHAFAQHRTVGEVGEDVVARQVGDPRLGLLLRRYVLVDRHPPSGLHGLMADRVDAAVAQLVYRIVGPRLGDRLQPLLDIVLGVVRTASLRHPCLQDGAQLGTGLGQLRRQPVHLAIAFVADHQPLIAVEHAQAVRHVPQRRVEQEVGSLQRALRAFERGGSGRELALAQRPDADREQHDGGQEQADLTVLARRQGGLPKDVVLAQSDGGEQRQSFHHPIGDQPFDALEGDGVARVPEASDRVFPKHPEHRAPRYRLTDECLRHDVAAAAGPNDAVEADERDYPPGPTSTEL